MANESQGEKVEEKTGKRGKYKRVECPHCHKMVGNLKNHILQKHSSELDNVPALDKEVLTGAKKPADIPVSSDKTIYYCENCHAELRKGEKECWNCGATLVWDGIE